MFQTRALCRMRLAFLFVLAPGVLASKSRAQAPGFTVTQDDSSVNFSVQASVSIAGKFGKWDATLKFASPDVTTGSLDIKAQAASVDTGSGMKDGKLKSRDLFDAEHDPYVTFQSTKVEQTGPNTFSILGTFTIRGVSKPETLTMTTSGERGSGSGGDQGSNGFRPQGLRYG